MIRNSGRRRTYAVAVQRALSGRLGADIIRLGEIVEDDLDALVAAEGLVDGVGINRCGRMFGLHGRFGFHVVIGVGVRRGGGADDDFFEGHERVWGVVLVAQEQEALTFGLPLAGRAKPSGLEGPLLALGVLGACQRGI